jgi:hypothetical protein
MRPQSCERTLMLLLSPREAVGRGRGWGVLQQTLCQRSSGWNRSFSECRTTPHPRPLPATRDARGGRGVQQRCSLVRNDGAIFPIQISNSRYAPAFSRHDIARVLRFVVPQNKREQGMPDARCTRGLVCKIERKNAHEHTGSAEALQHSLRNGFTVYNALSPENRALLSPSPANKWRIRARSGRLAFSPT